MSGKKKIESKLFAVKTTRNEKGTEKKEIF